MTGNAPQTRVQVNHELCLGRGLQGIVDLVADTRGTFEASEGLGHDAGLVDSRTKALHATSINRWNSVGLVLANTNSAECLLASGLDVDGIVRQSGKGEAVQENLHHLKLVVDVVQQQGVEGLSILTPDVCSDGRQNAFLTKHGDLVLFDDVDFRRHVDDKHLGGVLNGGEVAAVSYLANIVA